MARRLGIHVFECVCVFICAYRAYVLKYTHTLTTNTHTLPNTPPPPQDVALVQSPQSFFGVPVNDPLGQQYRYFYGPVLQVGSRAACGWVGG